MSIYGNKITMRCFKNPLCSLCAIFCEWEVIPQVFMWGWLWGFAVLLPLFLSKELCKQQLIEADEVICVQNVLSCCYILCTSLEEAWHNHQQQILSLNIGQDIERTARPHPFLQFLLQKGGKNVSYEGSQSLEFAVQRFWDISILGSFQDPTGYGPEKFGPNSIIGSALNRHWAGDCPSSLPAWMTPWL